METYQYLKESMMEETGKRSTPMKTLIVYATKHGATREIATRISVQMKDAEIHDLKEGNLPNLSNYDCTVIGSAIYAGTVRKEVKEFLAKNESALMTKKLGLFVSGMDPSKEEEDFLDNFPQSIREHATTTSLLGGIFDPKKANAVERLVMKAVAKKVEYSDTINDDRINQFVRAITTE